MANIYIYNIYFFIQFNISFIQSSVDRHLGCFHVLAIFSSAAMNIKVQLSFWIRVFGFSGYITMSRTAI